jgi:Ras GTPase-activating-like protein IQGAP2/3
MYTSVALQYVKPKHNVYARDALQAIIREIIESNELDLEADPCLVRLRIVLLYCICIFP